MRKLLFYYLFTKHNLLKSVLGCVHQYVWRRSKSYEATAVLCLEKTNVCEDDKVNSNEYGNADFKRMIC